MINQAIILAAGQGTRSEKITRAMHKACIKINGIEIIKRHCINLAKDGIKHIIIHTGYQKSHIQNLLGDGTNIGVSIKYSEEPIGSYNTGGAIAIAQEQLNTYDHYLLLSADIVFNHSLKKLLQSKPYWAKLLLNEKNINPDFYLRNGKINYVEEGSKVSFTGIGVLHPRITAYTHKQHASFKDIIQSVMNRGIEGDICEFDMVNCNTPSDFYKAEILLSKEVSL